MIGEGFQIPGHPIERVGGVMQIAVIVPALHAGPGEIGLQADAHPQRALGIIEFIELDALRHLLQLGGLFGDTGRVEAERLLHRRHGGRDARHRFLAHTLPVMSEAGLIGIRVSLRQNAYLARYEGRGGVLRVIADILHVAMHRSRQEAYSAFTEVLEVWRGFRDAARIGEGGDYGCSPPPSTDCSISAIWASLEACTLMP